MQVRKGLKFPNMFGRSKPPAAQLTLADRVRQIGERSAALGPDRKAQRQSLQRLPRQPVFKNGTLQFASDERISVVVKDVSENGVRVEFFANLLLPNELLLIATTLKLKRRARVIWQRPGVAGLRFID